MAVAKLLAGEKAVGLISLMNYFMKKDGWFLSTIGHTPGLLTHIRALLNVSSTKVVGSQFKKN